MRTPLTTIQIHLDGYSANPGGFLSGHYIQLTYQLGT
jgi:hypothetical protein